jgi:hypothetical protein
MRRDGRVAGRLLRVRESFEEQKKIVSPSSLNFVTGSGEVLGGFRPAFIYPARGRWWFFTLPFALAFCFGFRNLRE